MIGELNRIVLICWEFGAT